MLIFTDAGYKNGVGSHGFIVQHWNNQVIKSVSFTSNETDSNKSEITSIVSALNWLGGLRKGTKRRPRIYTDSLVVYEAVNGIGNHSLDVTYIKHQLKQYNASLFWRKRGCVEKAHKLAKVEMNSKHNHMEADKLKVKYKCEGVSKFKSSKKKNTYKNKVRGF